MTINLSITPSARGSDLGIGLITWRNEAWIRHLEHICNLWNLDANNLLTDPYLFIIFDIAYSNLTPQKCPFRKLKEWRSLPLLHIEANVLPENHIQVKVGTAMGGFSSFCYLSLTNFLWFIYSPCFAFIHLDIKQNAQERMIVSPIWPVNPESPVFLWIDSSTTFAA